MPPMRFKLRTLLILLAIGPPLLAVPFWQSAREWERQVNCSNGYVTPAIRQERAARQERSARLLARKR
jgi:hypothetical protein